jgi:hypothetical protein
MAVALLAAANNGSGNQFDHDLLLLPNEQMRFSLFIIFQ